MKRNASVGRVALEVGAYAFLGLSLLHCNKGGVVGESRASGGVTGGAGDQAAAAGGGGGSVSDAISLHFNMDTPPASWGPADAPQGPAVPVTPTVDSNCGNKTVTTTRELVDVLLVLDRSGSMDYSINDDCYCTRGAGTPVCSGATASCTTRRDALKPALSATLANSSNVKWGLEFFNSPSATPTSSSNCTVNSVPDVKIDELNAASVIQSKVDATTLSTGTPTAAALLVATDYLKTVADTNKKVILLATDGEPNCAGNPPNVMTNDPDGAKNAASAAAAAGFPVYVVGIGPSAALTTLSQLALAGGTTDYFPATSADQLTQSLSSISKLAGSCSFTFTDAPVNPNNVAVYVNKQRVDKDPDNGWTYGVTTQEIILAGDACAQMSTGDTADVQILFGCEDATPFPSYVP